MPDCDITDERSVEETIQTIFDVHLGWGGRFEDFTDTKVVLKTPILGHDDLCIIEGSKEEIRPILELAAMWTKCFSEKGDVIDEVVSSPIVKQTKGSPFLLSAIGGMAVGNARMKKFQKFVLGLND
jgi:hypothetical protein